jgi:hypothetical protein
MRSINNDLVTGNIVTSFAFIFAVAGLFPFDQSVSLGEESSRPNVLVIAVDDLSDYVSLLQNYPGIKTPNFDRLAKRSVNFTRAFCAAPICNPSRVAVLTGLAQHQTGVYQLGDRMTRSEPAMAAVALEENFRHHGYDTYLTGKYYHASEDHWLPKTRFDDAWTQRFFGRSVVPLIKTPDAQWPYVAVTSHDVGSAAISDRRYHYIHYADGSKELYDHETDPREYVRLAGKNEFELIIERLSQSIPKSWKPNGRNRIKNRQNFQE